MNMKKRHGRHSKGSGKTPAGGRQADPARKAALEQFAGRLQKLLGLLPETAARIQELLGRPDRPDAGLLGGDLLAVLNEAVLNEQAGRLAEALAHRRAEAEDLADQADFVGGLLSEYGVLLKVLAEVELEENSDAFRAWHAVADRVLQQGSEIGELAEELEVQLEGEEARAAAPAGANRAQAHSIWERSQRGEAVTGEDARLAAAMEEHPEYRVAWESPQRLSEGTIGGVNPYLHVTMHTIVENQLAQNEPLEAAEALERLLAAGVARHEAIHRIGNLMLRQIWRIQRGTRPFDRQAYIRALKSLK
jgi:hypothetical protein